MCTIVYVVIIKFGFTPFRWQAKLINPAGVLIDFAQPTSTPTTTPQQFKFDQSTDLKKELDSVSPKVEDGDFSDLQY